MNEQDHIESAHAKRAAIHGWLKENSDSSMAELAAAFPQIPLVTVRKSVQRLVKLEYIEMTGTGVATVYRAIGEAIYSVADMRARMRTPETHRNCNRDRIARTWETRRQIHAFILERQMVRMDQITAAFRKTPAATIHKHIRALIDYGNVSMHGKSVASRYSAATSEIYKVDDVREKLRKNGRAVGALSTSAHSAYNPPAIAARESEPQPCGYYRNDPGKKRPWPNARGQGAL